MDAYQQINGGTQQLTVWMKFYGAMSEIQISEGTQQHTNWIGFIGTYQQLKCSPGTQQTHSLDGIS